nr:hypothetical protein [Sulfurovaceae bacterium]
MLPQYQDARHEVRDGIIDIITNLAENNQMGLEAIKSNSVADLQSVREKLKGLNNTTETIDNKIVLIFVKFTPEARDLREIVSYLKITSALNRIQTNINSYIKNMQLVVIEDNSEMKEFINDSLLINQCTLNAFGYTIDMLKTFDDNDKI